MVYAQQNYPQVRLGNGSLTIAEDGCMLAAFCNLLARFGEPVDPPTLNSYFINQGAYLRDSDGADEDLAWNSVTFYDRNVIVTGSGAGVPSSANAIVKFHYNSVHTGLPIDHYCLVDHIDGRQIFILDSWDGLVKGPAQYEPVYHNVLAFATYEKVVPAPTPAPAAAPAAPLRAPSLSDTYQVVAVIPGYLSSNYAANHINSNATVTPGQYYVFNRFNGMVNVTKIPGQPGSWINPADNVAPAPDPIIPPAPPSAPAPAADPASTGIQRALASIAPEVIQAVTNPAPDWRTTYRPFVNKYGQRTPIKYIAMQNYVVHDLQGQKRDVPLHQYDYVIIGGTFLKDGTVYGRPQQAVDRFLWYGIPLDDGTVEPYEQVYKTQTTLAEREAMHAVKPGDYLLLGWENFRKLIDTIEKGLDSVLPGKDKNKVNK